MNHDVSELDRRPEGVTDATVEALGKLSAALDHVEEARGLLYAFHRRMGSAERTLEEATSMLHDALAADLDSQALGANPLPGMWSFQLVEAFDDGYHHTITGLERRARGELVGGRQHVFEAEMKALRRTPGEPGHEAAPVTPPT